MSAALVLARRVWQHPFGGSDPMTKIESIAWDVGLILCGIGLVELWAWGLL